MQRFTFIDLFCGIGGFRIGLEAAFKKHNIDLECVLSADIKSDAIKVYNHNFGENNKELNVRDLKEADVPQFDIVCAGFPCQPFSAAGSKQGLGDERGNLIFEVVKLCKLRQPKIIILENVPNLLTMDGGKVIKRIKKEFEDIGYHISYSLLDSSDFTVPQIRKRVFIVGTLEREIDLSLVQHMKALPLKHVIDKEDTTTNIPDFFLNALLKLPEERLYNCSIKDKRGGANNIHSWDLELFGKLDDVQKSILNKLMLERRKKHWAEKKEIPWMDGMPLTLQEINTFVDMTEEQLNTQLEHLVKIGYLKKEKPKDLVNGKRAYKTDAVEGYNINRGKLSFPLSQILNMEGFAPTLTATDCNKLGIKIGCVIRRLNKHELKRICGFPETYDVSSPKVNYYDLFGNMVCPPVVEQIACTIIKQLKLARD